MLFEHVYTVSSCSTPQWIDTQAAIARQLLVPRSGECILLFYVGSAAMGVLCFVTPLFDVRYTAM